MSLRNKIYFIIIATSYFIAVLFVLGVAAKAEEAAAHAVEQEIVTGPGQHDVSLISSQPWLVEGESIGHVGGVRLQRRDDRKTHRLLGAL